MYSLASIAYGNGRSKVQGVCACLRSCVCPCVRACGAANRSTLYIPVVVTSGSYY